MLRPGGRVCDPLATSVYVSASTALICRLIMSPMWLTWRPGLLTDRRRRVVHRPGERGRAAGAVVRGADGHGVRRVVRVPRPMVPVIWPVFGSMLRPGGRVWTPATTSLNVPGSAPVAVTNTPDTEAPSLLVWLGRVGHRRRHGVHVPGEGWCSRVAVVRGADRDRVGRAKPRLGGQGPGDDARVRVDAQAGRQRVLPGDHVRERARVGVHGGDGDRA